MEQLKSRLNQEDFIKLYHKVKKVTKKWNLIFDFEVADIINVCVKQNKCPDGKRIEKKELREIVNKIFYPYFRKEELNISITVPKEPFISLVTIPWIKQQMFEFGLTRDDIITETGVNESEVKSIFKSKQLNPMTRAMFYFYLKSKN